MKDDMGFPTAPKHPPGSSTNAVNSDNLDRGTGRDIGEPSKSRRDALKNHNKDAPISLSNLCPITKYYSAADKVLEQFKIKLDFGDLDEAYILGRRFALFSTASLPKHDYYTSPQADLVRLRVKNQKDAQWVTLGLERIVQVMDKQELQKQKEAEERSRQRIADEETKHLEWQTKMRERLIAVKSSRLGELDPDECASDMNSKLENLDLLFPKDGDRKISRYDSNEAREQAENYELPFPLPLPLPISPPPVDTMNTQDLALFYSTCAAQQLKSNGATPMFADSDPPSYSDLFLDTLRTGSSTKLGDVSTPEPSVSNPPPSQKIPVRTLLRKYSHELDSMQSSKTIEILKLGTYQGRLSSSPQYDSTNGCTVISPLIVATHVYPQHQQKNTLTKQKPVVYKRGISNTEINDIIDKRAAPILQTVRSKLGLNHHAMIVPSDVHDYLVDEEILPQEKFVGACGGNILNSEHWVPLVNMLMNGRENDNVDPRRQKSGAALFFRDHVVSIVKIPLGNGACYFDLIDSLPSSNTGGMASRTRCKDQMSFEAFLQFYACSKFSDSQCDFIDANDWNDGMCDFDPRVFQGFVWAE